MSDKSRGTVAERGVEERTRPSAGDVFYRGLVEGMRCAILTIDSEGGFLSLNGLAAEILDIEVPDDDRVGRASVAEVLGRHERLAQVLVDSLEMSHPPNRAELEVSTRSGGTKTIGFTISPILSDGGTQGMAIFFKDLTQVERMEERDRLRDRLAALGQMAASLAHEIRNPLASIDVTVSLLRRRLADSPRDVEALDKIRDEVARLNSTVKQGLEFARPITPEMSPQSLASLARTAIEEAGHRFPQTTLDIATEFEPDAPDPTCDPELIRRMIVNFIVNGFEAMGGEGRMTIGIRTSSREPDGSGSVEMTVADEGPGLPPEVREKIFHPFVTTKRDGSGIGLAMARKIVECHHGMIDVADRPDGGTIFRVRLPCVGGDERG